MAHKKDGEEGSYCQIQFESAPTIQDSEAKPQWLTQRASNERPSGSAVSPTVNVLFLFLARTGTTHSKMDSTDSILRINARDGPLRYFIGGSAWTSLKVPICRA